MKKQERQELSEDFNEVVKPFANEVKLTNGKWSIVMQNWLEKSPQKHIHMKQIDTTIRSFGTTLHSSLFSKN